MKLGYRSHNGTDYRVVYDKEGIQKGNSWCNIRYCKGVPSSMKGVLELHSLYTEEGYRKAGLAGKLMASVCEEATNSGITLLLSVELTNKSKLIAFYSKFGFAVIQDDGNACIMIRNPIGDVMLDG